jgi:hypothetical protein
MWPQWTFLILLVLGLGISLGKDGQPRTNWSFWSTLFNSVITLLLLYYGGFFKGIF